MTLEELRAFISETHPDHQDGLNNSTYKQYQEEWARAAQALRLAISKELGSNFDRGTSVFMVNEPPKMTMGMIVSDTVELSEDSMKIFKTLKDVTEKYGITLES